MPKIQKQIYALRDELKRYSNSERAVQEKRYLKSPFKFFGVSLPLTDKIAKEFRKSNSDASRKYILELAQRMWDSEYHDEKRLGLRMLQFYPECLNLSIMPVLEKMLMQSTGWDLVDDISIHLVGAVLEKNKKAFNYLKKWSKSENFWMRRASLISQILLFRQDMGDKKLFFEFAERMVSEKEFFIRKAIGWGLREMAKANPDEAFNFLMKIKNKASGLTLREGSKRLPEKMKKAITGK
ncbi:MAG: DNA alkylation repair protein [Nitrospirae bacterium]|nr:DNA alkylation repair protein [Nitrospirota bacterium]MBI3378525.1 DNA alkylation repair protein [Nitrospirota bacterium]